MKINGVDIEQYGARQWNLHPGYSGFSNESEKTEGALVPSVFSSDVRLKKFKVDVLLKGSSRQEIWEAGNFLIASLLKPSEIEFDGFEHLFFGVLVNATQAESCMRRWHKATLELQGYEYGREECFNLRGGKRYVVFNPGTLESPVALTVDYVPEEGTRIINGICRTSLEEKKLVVNCPCIIDYARGIAVTLEGENCMDKVDMWALPSLLPGENIITVSDTANLIVRFRPLYV